MIVNLTSFFFPSAFIHFLLKITFFNIEHVNRGVDGSDQINGSDLIPFLDQILILDLHQVQ